MLLGHNTVNHKKMYDTKINNRNIYIYIILDSLINRHDIFIY